ncbi:hypothetical protein R1sor_017460 [Riccia sorocarpa]|uniref:Uncharacterized protein n=1 Tax=Riccia sorocarpa TaxID=122646 RepID=A0ABD3I6X6_9MARC
MDGADNCEIAGQGRSFEYLGVAISSPVDEKAITEEIVTKLMKKLKHWSNRLLSWPAKTILLKHVLAATLLYQLMSWTLHKGLLLLPLTRIDGSPTLTRMLGSWYRMRKRLRWNNDIGELDVKMSILQVKAVQQIANGGGVGSLAVGRELGLLRRMDIVNLEEAMDQL